MENAAISAGRALIRDFGEVENLQVSRKGPRDFVSSADIKAERIIKEKLLEYNEHYGFLCEESGEERGKNHNFRWIIDPLDGTNNFLHGLPHWAISIALEEIVEGGKREIIAACVYAPITNEFFWAEKGKGSFSAQRRLHVSKRDNTDEAMVAFYLPRNKDGAELFASMAGLRREMGCASLELAYVASGKIDCLWNFHLKPWDMAAGILLVQEAKGIVSEINGGKQMIKNNNIFASNKPLAEHYRSKLQPLCK